MKCSICSMRVGRVLTAIELEELKNHLFTVPDSEVCKFKQGDECKCSRN
jgi:hypothetical protein